MVMKDLRRTEKNQFFCYCSRSSKNLPYSSVLLEEILDLELTSSGKISVTSILSGLLFLNQARPASLIRRLQPGGDKKDPSLMFFSDNHM